MASISWFTTERRMIVINGIEVWDPWQTNVSSKKVFSWWRKKHVSW
jgi:hypothetical protein